MRILIVDDEAVSRTKLKTLLSPRGECELAASAMEAGAAVQSALDANRPYDLITMDVEMPDGDGHVAVATIRSMEKARQVTQPACIIMVTSRNDAATVVDAIKAGCNGYLIKPFSADRVQKEIARLGLIPS